MSDDLWQVTAPHFCAGIVTTGDRVTEAAPILRWTIGRSRAELRIAFLAPGMDGAPR